MKRRYKTVEVEVEVDVHDVLDTLDDADIAEIAREHGFEARGEGDPQSETIVERAYLAARRMADLPREISDLFCHVHGRAI